MHKKVQCACYFLECVQSYCSAKSCMIYQILNLKTCWGTKHKILFPLGLCAHLHTHKWAMCTLLFAMCTIIYLSQIRSDFHQTSNLRYSLGTKHNIIVALWWCAHMHALKTANGMLLLGMCTMKWLNQIKYSTLFGYNTTKFYLPKVVCTFCT